MLRYLHSLDQIPDMFDKQVTFYLRINSYPVLQKETDLGGFKYFVDRNRALLDKLFGMHLLYQQQTGIANQIMLMQQYTVSVDDERNVYYFDLTVQSAYPLTRQWFKALSSLIGRYKHEFI